MGNKIQTDIYKTEKELDILLIQRQALEQESARNVVDTTGKEAELTEFDAMISGLQQRLGDAENVLNKLTEAEKKIQEQVRLADNDLTKVKESITLEKP